MRIAVVSPFVDRRHGTERAIAELIDRLAKKYACEVHIYAERVEDVALDDAASRYTAGKGTILWHRVPHIPGPHLLSFLGWMFLNASLRRWHQRFRCAYDLLLSPGINSLHPDVVIVHALFCRLQELAREDEAAVIVPGGMLRRLHRRLYYALLAALERRIYTNRKVSLIAVSGRTAALLEARFFRKDVTVVPNGVDCREFSPARRRALRDAARRKWGFSDDECVLLLLGNDWRVKGLSAVLEALALLRGLPLRLLAVGNENPAYYHDKARQLGVVARCLWQHTDSIKVIDLYAAADIYVSPSREDSFALPVAESMACGLPVITSTCAGVSDFVRDGVDGFILQDPRDTHRLAEIVRRLQADGQLRQNIGEAAATGIRQWDWDRNAASIWELLKQDTTVKAARTHR